jgi:hypothetical protein
MLPKLSWKFIEQACQCRLGLCRALAIGVMEHQLRQSPPLELSRQ